jgi:hypothetical protein
MMVVMASTKLATREVGQEAVLSDFEAAVAEAIVAGKRPWQIAKQLAKGDLKKTRSLNKRIRRLMWNDAWMAHAVEGYKRAAAIDAITTRPALAKRASRGRTDAHKLLLEVSGLHNPRVQHEHSGDIRISLTTVPRPVATSEPDEPIVDADVVEG